MRLVQVLVPGSTREAILGNSMTKGTITPRGGRRVATSSDRLSVPGQPHGSVSSPQNSPFVYASRGAIKIHAWFADCRARGTIGAPFAYDRRSLRYTGRRSLASVL